MALAFRPVSSGSFVPLDKVSRKDINNICSKVCPRAVSSPPSSSPSCSDIPQLEPFNRSRLSRLIREPSLLEKAERAISDHCTLLEGDEAYKCWEALFDFEDLKDEYKEQCDVARSEDRSKACRPLERLENVVRQSGGVTSLIDNVAMIAKINKISKAAQLASQGDQIPSCEAEAQEAGHRHFFPEPESLPPSQEELELKESARMPESPFTRLLRRMGHSSS